MMVRSWFLTFVIVLLALLIAYYDYFLIGLFLFSAFIIHWLMSKEAAIDLLVLSIIALVALLYFNFIFTPFPKNLPSYDEYQLSGYVANYPSYNGQRGNFILKVENQSFLKQKVQVFSNFDPGLSKGDKVELKGKLTPPTSPGNPGEFDYKTYLAREKIYYIVNLDKPENLMVLEPNTNILFKLSNSYRQKLEILANETMGEEAAGILLGMLIGKIDGIDQNEYEDYQKTGIVHVFSVSGLHVGFLLIFCYGVITLLNLSSRIKFYVSLVVLFIYGTLVGWPVTVIRASLMGALGLLALYVKREKNLLDSLGLAGLLIIIIDPYAPFKIGFQLSFVATWGLVYLYPLIKTSLSIKNRIIDYILIPVCAQIPTIPFIAYHFNLFSAISVISNIVLGYILGVIVILGFAAMTVLFFSKTLFTIIAIPISALIELVQGINSWLVSLPLAYVHVATPSLLTIMLYFIGLALIICFLNRRVNQIMAIAGLGLIVIFMVVIILPASFYNKGKLEVVVMDVGQGDSILVKSPQGRFILIDGGGSDFTDVGKRKVLAYLNHRGIRNLFLAINTHPDTDHLRGLETVLSEVAVENIGIPYTLRDVENYRYLKTIAQQQKSNLIPLAKGQTLNIEPNFTIEVLHPEASNYNLSNYNDESIVLLAKYYQFSMLLTGDIEKVGLERMLVNHNHKLPQVTVLKIPHHGSRNSLVPELYQKTSPKYGIISAGRNNSFGHPHEEILEQLSKEGAIPLRTDQGGLIHIESDGKHLQVKRPMQVD